MGIRYWVVGDVEVVETVEIVKVVEIVKQKPQKIITKAPACA